MLPSLHLRKKFLKLASDKNLFGQESSKKIFIPPVFEVADGFQIPETKTELQKEYAEGSIRQFHNETCYLCHFPQNTEEWIKGDLSNDFDYQVRVRKFFN